MGVTTLPAVDYVPEKEAFAWAMRWLRLNRSGGLSGIQVEHLRKWLRDATNWRKVVETAQAEFCDRTLTYESMWQMVFFIPKGDNRDLCGISIVEV